MSNSKKIHQDNKKILLIITGSIAAYKTIDLIRILKKKNYDVTCILTKAAQKFITPLLCSSISGNKTYTKLFSVDDEIEMGHINLSRTNDLIVVAPASADFIAKLANGYGDDLASTTILASNKKIIIAPAMNQKMWDNEQNQINLKKIAKSGVKIIDPETDILACGEYGTGKMSDPIKIADQIDDFFKNKDLLKGHKILLTGGGTIEPIDPVRFIGNHSSGKQAIEIAKTLQDMGAEITFISANIKLNIPINQDNVISCITANQMYEEVKKYLKINDVFISCAAVSDYRVKNPSLTKIKKNNDILNLELEKNIDILNYVGNCQDRPKIVVGFAAESDDIKKNSLKKLNEKKCDFIVANDISGGEIFGSNLTKSYIVSKDNYQELGTITKSQLAKIISIKISDLLKDKSIC